MPVFKSRYAPVVIVKTLADWAANPGSILRPDESQIERLIINHGDNKSAGPPPYPTGYVLPNIRIIQATRNESADVPNAD